MLLRFTSLGMEWPNIKTNQCIGVMRLPVLKAFVVRDMCGCERLKVVLVHIVCAIWHLCPHSAADISGGPQESSADAPSCIRESAEPGTSSNTRHNTTQVSWVTAGC